MLTKKMFKTNFTTVCNDVIKKLNMAIEHIVNFLYESKNTFSSHVQQYLFNGYT